MPRFDRPWIVYASMTERATQSGGLQPTWLERLKDLGDGVQLVDSTEEGRVLGSPRAALMRLGGPPGAGMANALEIQKRLASKGCQIFNPLEMKYFSSDKLASYARWLALGMEAPFALACPSRFEIDNAIALGLLDWPIVLRVSNGSMGRKTYLAANWDEFDRMSEELSKTCRRWIATEFIDTKGPDGLHRKWRAYVIGDRVDVWEAGINQSWIVNNSHSTDFPADLFKTENEMPNWPRHWDADLVRAAQIMSASVCAIDVVRSPINGKPVLLDVNLGYLFSAPDAWFPQDVAEARSWHFRHVVEWLSAVA